MGAADIGANHQRDRIWILATNTRQHRCRERQDQQKYWQLKGATDLGVDGKKKSLADTTELFSNGCNDHAGISMERETQSESRNDCGAKNVADTDSAQRQGNQCSIRIGSEYADIGSASWWAVEPDVDRVVDGVAARVDRLKAIGNGQVPLCAAEAFRILSGG
jgi:DNA (cytosine-5)-methyltransferase 1